MCVAQRRHVDVEDVEAVEEVGAQVALGDGVAGVAIGGGEDADIDILLGARAKAAKLAFLEDAQQLGLGADGHFADLVEQQRAAGGQLEAAGAALDGAGEGAFFVAEDFAFDERFRDGGAVDGDEGPRLARAEVVKGAGDQLLAGAAFAGDEDGDVGGGDLFDQAEDLAHGLARAADHGAEDAGLAQAAAGDFQLDCGIALAGGVGEDGAQAGGVDGLLQEVVGAELHGVNGDLDGALGGQQDHGDVGSDAGAFFGKLGQQAECRRGAAS